MGSRNEFAKEGAKLDNCAPEDCSTCGEDCGSRIDLNERVIEITTDDGDKMRCLVMLKYAIGIKIYVAVMPLKDNPEGDIYLFRTIKNKTELQNIDDEDEYEQAAEAFGIEMEKAQKELAQKRLEREEREAAKKKTEKN